MRRRAFWATKIDISRLIILFVGDKWYVLLDLMVLVLRLNWYVVGGSESLKGGFVTVGTPRKTMSCV